MLSDLQDWFARQCDGDWEHQAGISIETTDNPGWFVQVDLNGLDCTKALAVEKENHRRSDFDFLTFKFDQECESLSLACGPKNLAAGLDILVQYLK